MSNSASDFGKDYGLIHEVIITGRKLGAGKDFWTVLQNEDMFRRVMELVNSRPVYRGTIDYNRSLPDMIKACNCDWVNGEVEKIFSVTGEGKVDFTTTLFSFKEAMGSKEVIDWMNGEGYRPAVIEGLLALGESHPDLQREFPLIALGSVGRDGDGDRCVPYLDGYGSRRGLDLNFFGRGWDAGCRFPAVRKF